MADNVDIKDGASQTVEIAAKDIGGVLYPKHIIVDPLGNEISFPGLQALYQSAFFGGAPVSYSNGQMAPLQVNAYGVLRVSHTWGNGREAKALRADLAFAPTTIDSSDALQTQGALTYRYDSTAARMRPDAVASKSTIIASAAASDNETALATTATNLRRVTGYSARASTPWYLKIYDKASAINPASDVPVLVYEVPPASAFSFDLDGFAFQNGARIRTVTGAAHTDATAVAAGDFRALTITRTH